jgi:hypothetical protein
MVLSRPNPAPNQHMNVPHALAGFTPVNKNVGGAPRAFTANAAGSTTTIVGTNADAVDLAIGDRVRLYNSSNTLKDNKLFTITNEQLDTPGAGSTTFTFTPAATGATASGDYISIAQDISEVTNTGTYADIASLDARLQAINSGVYTQARLNTMTLNDKIFAVKSNDDPELQ